MPVLEGAEQRNLPAGLEHQTVVAPLHTQVQTKAVLWQTSQLSQRPTEITYHQNLQWGRSLLGLGRTPRRRGRRLVRHCWSSETKGKFNDEQKYNNLQPLLTYDATVGGAEAASSKKPNKRSGSPLLVGELVGATLLLEGRGVESSREILIASLRYASSCNTILVS